MPPIILLSIKQNYKLPLFLGVGLSAVGVLFAALFEEFRDKVGDFAAVVPAEYSAIIGDLAISDTPEGWLAMELFPLFVMIGMAILGLVLGAGLIGREENSGTIEILLASPCQRVNLIWQKYFALAKLLAIAPTLLFLTIAISTFVFEFHPNLAHVAAACVSAWAFGLVFGSLTFAVQAASGRRGLALGIGSAVFLAMYALTIISKLVESWADYDQWSLIYYYNIPGALLDGMDWWKFSILIITSLALAAISAIGFNRRDLKN